MIRVTVTFKAQDDNAAAEALRHVAEQIEDGYTMGLFNSDDIEESKYDVEKLCEFCDGEGEIDDGDKIKKCFNCNGPDYDAQREGK